MKNKKVILITGNAGFIGYHIAKSLMSKNTKIIGVDNNNLLSKKKGKVSVLKKHINLNNKTSIVLGDGYTDYELKKYNEAKYFIQFIENINRKSLNKHADIIVENFNEVITFLESLHE